MDVKYQKPNFLNLYTINNQNKVFKLNYMKIVFRVTYHDPPIMETFTGDPVLDGEITEILIVQVKCTTDLSPDHQTQDIH